MTVINGTIYSHVESKTNRFVQRPQQVRRIPLELKSFRSDPS